MERIMAVRKACGPLIAMAVTLTPGVVWADCIPSAPVGYMVLATVSTHSANNLVSYSTGTLTFGAGWKSLSPLTQLFSNRFVKAPPGVFASQPFDIESPDNLGVAITDKSGSITLILTLQSWGNVTASAQATCDGALLRANLNYPGQGDTDVVVSFGTPQRPPQ
jgi:hypothetical protein